MDIDVIMVMNEFNRLVWFFFFIGEMLFDFDSDQKNLLFIIRMFFIFGNGVKIFFN